MIKLYHGDCLEVMDEIIKQDIKVDAIITDPPYGTTACKWDSVIPFDEMWLRLNKLIKSNGAIVLFGSEPFSSALRMSNIKNYKCDWVWQKAGSSNFFQAKFVPLNPFENISVFSLGGCNSGAKNPMKYYPQGIKEVNKKTKNSKSIDGGVGINKGCAALYGKEYIYKATGYPIKLLKFNVEKKGFHPTQKPIALLEYLIKTYTLEGETVLDFTMGSGTTGVAAKNLNRKFIGIENNEKYFKIAQDRINNAEKKTKPPKAVQQLTLEVRQ